jgi:hypothetical protein
MFTRRLVCVHCEWPTEHVEVWDKWAALWECQKCRNVRTLADALVPSVIRKEAE